MRETIPAIGRAARGTDVYLGAGATAGLAGAFHAFSGFGTHRFAQMLGLGAQGDGVLISSMVLGFALGTWAWGRLGDGLRPRAAAFRVAPCVALVVWVVLSLCPPARMATLAVLLFAAGAASAGFCNVYAILDDPTEVGARSGVKAVSNCGIALGAAVIQVGQGALPPQLAALPCLLVCAMACACCRALSRRAAASTGRSGAGAAVPSIVAVRGA